MHVDSSPSANFFAPAYRNQTNKDSNTENQSEEDNVSVKREARVKSAGHLSDEELTTVRALQQRDREVRAHEMAHVAVGGELVLRGAQFEYETGPDGIRYAIGGDVIIDTSPDRTPEATIEKAQRIRATALAPAEPSPQDRAVAAMATQMALQAQIELAMQQRTQSEESTQASRIDKDGSPMSLINGERMRDAYFEIASLSGGIGTARIDAFA